MWYPARLTPQSLVPTDYTCSQAGRKDVVDKRKAWREQEQQLVQNWNAAAQRYREIMAQIATENPLGTPEGPSADIQSKAAAVRAEIEALRKKVARLKAEFNSGKRY